MVQSTDVKLITKFTSFAAIVLTSTLYFTYYCAV